MNRENQPNADERIRKLIEQYAEIQAEVAQLSNENAELMKVTNKLTNKVAKLQKEIRKTKKKTAQRSSETADHLEESEIQDDVFDEVRAENRKLIREITDYPEQIARRYIGRILEKRFDADFLGSIKLEYDRDAGPLEVDAWGISRSETGAAYIVEIKEEFCDEHIDEVWQQIERFRSYKSDYGERAVYPMLAVWEISEEDRTKVWNAGIHLIDIDDDDFCRYAKPPDDFEANGYHGVHGAQRSVPNLQLVVGGVKK